jgi:hypothetical protein
MCSAFRWKPPLCSSGLFGGGESQEDECVYMYVYINIIYVKRFVMRTWLVSIMESGGSQDLWVVGELEN